MVVGVLELEFGLGWNYYGLFCRLGIFMMIFVSCRFRVSLLCSVGFVLYVWVLCCFTF